MRMTLRPLRVLLMKMRSLFATLFFIISSLNQVHSKSDAGRHNVLFIAIDDLNDWVGCLKTNSQARTPNIDRLASRGVLFTNAHCQAPICCSREPCSQRGDHGYTFALTTFKRRRKPTNELNESVQFPTAPAVVSFF